MDPIIVKIAQAPQGKGRARARLIKTKAGREFISHYTPTETRAYEAAVSWEGKRVMGSRQPLAGPLRVDMIIRSEPSESWPEWKRYLALMGFIRPDMKPDPDNVKKAVYDALNGVCWVDDCQIVEWAGRKEFHTEPSVLVKIQALDALTSSTSRFRDLPATLVAAFKQRHHTKGE